MSSVKRSHVLASFVQYGFMVLCSILFLFPLYWMVSRSLMNLSELYEVPLRLFPKSITFQAYQEIWSIKPFHLYFLNTMIIIVFTLIGATLSSSLCAYGFARLKFPFRNFLFALVLSTMMLPAAVTMIPVYMIFSELNWTNTFLPLTVPAFFGGGAFNIFLLRQFFNGIPRDFDEAARIDGASNWTIFIRIALPVCMPAITVVSVFTFIGVWNDFMGPLLYLNKEENFTLALGLNSLSPGGVGQSSLVNTAQLMAACCVTIIPVVTVFFLAQKRLISGTVLSTGIKG